MNEKICTKCLIKKPLTREFFSRLKEAKDGFSFWCKTCSREYCREYHKANKELISIRNASRYQLEKQKCIKSSSEYIKDRTKRDINFKLRANLRSRLRRAIKNNQKTGSAVQDLGCTIPELILHLSSLFSDGMNWYNYGNRKGQWSIDHIVPLSAFDLTNREQLLKACHYTNLQPMWQSENVRKGNKIGA